MTNVTTMVKTKIAERVFVHDGDLSKFHEEFPLRMLPSDFGGSNPAYDNTIWVQELLQPEEEEQETQLQTSAHIQALRRTQSAATTRSSPYMF